MRLTINGKTEQFSDTNTIDDLLKHYDLPAIRVAVEVNRELVPRGEYEQTALKEGDTIEIVTFVGGG